MVTARALVGIVVLRGEPRSCVHSRRWLRGRLPKAEAGAPQDQALHASDERSRGALQRAGSARGARHHNLQSRDLETQLWGFNQA